ncbi:MAG: class I SAM-dependent methyltransferase [Deltaproteobacteria bacterium]|nr:class I SAM-dependent methyltransferase [Deltaproteobacteria bacterium]
MSETSPLLTAHRALLERWRGSMNLVGPGPVDFHFRDAEAALDGLTAAGQWADLGSGAGFPGIAFASRFPEVELLLVESRQKRCVFLRAVLAEAGWGPQVSVSHGRVEGLAPGSLDGVMARAFAPWPAVLAHARRLLRPEGMALLMHGAEDEPEADDFLTVSRRSYAIDGRPRRVTLLQRRPGR